MPYSTQLFPEVTVGLDLGDRKTHWTKVDVNGQALERGEVAMTPQAVEKLFQGLPKGARVVMEAGGQSPWVSWLAVEAGHEVLVANTRQSGKNRKKTDALDADGLARKGRNSPEELHPIDHRSKEVFLDRVVLRARDELVSCRTKLINGVRSMVKVFGYRLRSSSAHGFNEKLLADLPERLARMFKPIFGRTAVVLGDSTLAGVLAPADYGAIRDVLIDGLRRGCVEEALAAAIRKAGDILAQKLPRAPDDRLEISNALRLLD